jgi:outer membrane receptor protein involved in Fe transport
LNLQSGVEGNYERRHSVSRNNFLGVYTFASLDDYVAGRPQTFTQNSGNPLLDSQQYDFNAFVQADWRAARYVSVGLGLRYIAQSNLRDYNNVAPTVSVAEVVTRPLRDFEEFSGRHAHTAPFGALGLSVEPGFLATPTLW